MGDVFPEIKEKREHIQRIIKGEEEGFNATLDRGLEIFEQVSAKALKRGSGTITGEDSFKLYDTYGFPLDLTQLLAREKGLSVDEGGFAKLLELQRERSREAGKGTGIQTGARGVAKGAPISQSEFTGYDTMEDKGTIVQLVDEYLILDRTPFYGESGGQVGDTGVLKVGQELVQISDTQKDGNLIVHKADHPSEELLGQTVIAQVEKERRLAIMRNHTATHLVHAALRKILGTHVHQTGSLVAPDHLRFDFAHFSRVSEEELQDVEALVNEKIRENVRLAHHRNIPFEEAKKMGALMFFGDKYGDRVNVVEFGEFSKEFCGGTHVQSTSEIGYFKFRSEGSVASGVRRIEAVTEEFAKQLASFERMSLLERLEVARKLFQEIFQLQSEIITSAGSSAILKNEFLSDMEKSLGTIERDLQFLVPDYSDLSDYFTLQKTNQSRLISILLELGGRKRSLEKEISTIRVRRASSELEELIEQAVKLNGIRLVAAKVQAGTMDELKSMGDSLRAKLGSGVGVLGAVVEDKVALVCVVTDDLLSSKKLNAGQVVGSVAKLVGGGGGGRPHMATAGGKDIHKLDEALQQTESIVKSLLQP
jgi:alanyl-tRNA synthetase